MDGWLAGWLGGRKGGREEGREERGKEGTSITWTAVISGLVGMLLEPS